MDGQFSGSFFPTWRIKMGNICNIEEAKNLGLENVEICNMMIYIVVSQLLLIG